jgi:glycosyltransferase involved in cell wall biosynthesis
VIRILVLPRDPNPYQGLLYSAMDRLGVQASYLGELTRSHTVNLLLLPAQLAWQRMAGARVVHLHWVAATFALPGARRFPVLRRLGQAWFLVWLRACRALGLRLVWTAHNVLPHEQVFADDVAARRALVRASDLVLAHSAATLAGLAALGAAPRRSVVIPHGPLPPGRPAAALRRPGSAGGPRQFLFFGRVQDYKGVTDLLAAFAALSATVPAELTVAGPCPDGQLQAELRALAAGAGHQVTLRLDPVPDDAVTDLLATADVVVLPFRRVTTSGTAILALCHGRPLIVPDLPGLAGLPGPAVLRYDGGIPGLAGALTRLAVADDQTLAAMSAAALSYAAGLDWPDIAQQTIAEITSVLGPARPGPARQPASTP